MANETVIYLHGWVEDDEGNQTYCDPRDARPDGWCVYVCTHFEDGRPSEPGRDERDFRTEDAAREWAETLAADLGHKIRTY